MNGKICYPPTELSPDGLPPGYLHHSHVGQEACLDNSFRGKQICIYKQLAHCNAHSHCGNQTPLRAASLLSVNCAVRLVQVSQSSGGSLLRYVVLIAARLSLLTMCGWVLCWTLVNLCKNHSVLNLLFLGYP